MTDSPTRPGLAVVGLGMAAKPHAAALKDLAERLDVRGVFARDPARRAAFAQEYDYPQAESLEALANDPAVTAALLITPPNARQDLVEMFARAGKHVLTEKPVERTSAAAEHIVTTCEDAGVKLGVVFQHRFRAGSQMLRKLTDEGAFGALAAAQIMVPWWRPQSYYDEPGRGTLARDGGGVLISQAIHSLDLMLSLTGPVAEVQAVAGTTRLHEMETEDFVGAGLRFANGAVGALSATTSAFPGSTEWLSLDFEKASARLESGTLTVAWHDGRTESYGEEATTGGGADPMAFPHDWHRDLIADFFDAIAQDRSPGISGREALRVHYLIDALLQSSAEGRAAKVKQDA